jgi:hypothetical protein
MRKRKDEHDNENVHEYDWGGEASPLILALS